MYIASWKQILVWDPVTADQHRLAVPPGFDFNFVPVIHLVSGAVVRAAGADHFQVVLVGTDKQQHRGAIACVYSSETGLWGKIISTPLPPEVYSGRSSPFISFMSVPSVLVGDSIYWLIAGYSLVILEFDLHRQNLTVIRLSEDMFAKKNCQFLIMRAEGGGLGYLFLSNYNAKLWKRKNGYDGVASWVLERTIELDKLLSLNPEEKDSPIMLGIAEHKNLVFMWTVTGLFTVQLESLEFKESFETNCWYGHQPFEGVYTAETITGGGHDGAALLLNT
ncbi:unnamed protein product [Triticum turgidum subsp. durum]|uniref:F-box protein AT5G49610-like beta-propeller domain-containing protein n=3 Tax=Triticum TaxID=4564 RepID=A0A9R0YF35_TRITD|nr:unnamed protein product [Triticum turgidum subsp. durum]